MKVTLLAKLHPIKILDYTVSYSKVGIFVNLWSLIAVRYCTAYCRTKISRLKIEFSWLLKMHKKISFLSSGKFGGEEVWQIVHN